MARGKNAEEKQKFIDALIENADNALSTMDIVKLSQTQINKLLADGHITQEQADILSGIDKPTVHLVQTINEPVNETMSVPLNEPVNNSDNNFRNEVIKIIGEYLSSFPQSRYSSTEDVDDQLDKVTDLDSRLERIEDILAPSLIEMRKIFFVK